MENYHVAHLNMLIGQINRLKQSQIRVQRFMMKAEKMDIRLYKSYGELYKAQEEHLITLQEMYDDITRYLEKSGLPYGQSVSSDRFF